MTVVCPLPIGWQRSTESACPTRRRSSRRLRWRRSIWAASSLASIASCRWGSSPHIPQPWPFALLCLQHPLIPCWPEASSSHVSLWVLPALLPNGCQSSLQGWSCLEFLPSQYSKVVSWVEEMLPGELRNIYTHLPGIFSSYPELLLGKILLQTIDLVYPRMVSVSPPVSRHLSILLWMSVRLPDCTLGVAVQQRYSLLKITLLLFESH